MTIKLEVGRRYVAAVGLRSGPVYVDSSGPGGFYQFAAVIDGTTIHYSVKGRMFDDKPGVYDLIALAPDEAPQQPENYEIRSINEILAAEAALRAKLESIRKEAETNQKWAFLEWRDKAEKAEAENARLRELLRRAVDFIGVTTEYKSGHTGASEIVNAGTATLAKLRGEA